MTGNYSTLTLWNIDPFDIELYYTEQQCWITDPTQHHNETITSVNERGMTLLQNANGRELCKLEPRDNRGGLLCPSR